ncbi:MAG: hypothetical protein AAGG80_06490, partial [Pseudomonadota bacterium]
FKLNNTIKNIRGTAVADFLKQIQEIEAKKSSQLADAALLKLISQAMTQHTQLNYQMNFADKQLGKINYTINLANKKNKLNVNTQFDLHNVHYHNHALTAALKLKIQQINSKPLLKLMTLYADEIKNATHSSFKPTNEAQMADLFVASFDKQSQASLNFNTDFPAHKQFNLWHIKLNFAKAQSAEKLKNFNELIQALRLTAKFKIPKAILDNYQSDDYATFTAKYPGVALLFSRQDWQIDKALTKEMLEKGYFDLKNNIYSTEFVLNHQQLTANDKLVLSFTPLNSPLVTMQKLLAASIAQENQKLSYHQAIIAQYGTDKKTSAQQNNQQQQQNQDQQKIENKMVPKNQPELPPESIPAEQLNVPPQGPSMGPGSEGGLLQEDVKAAPQQHFNSETPRAAARLTSSQPLPPVNHKVLTQYDKLLRRIQTKSIELNQALIKLKPIAEKGYPPAQILLAEFYLRQAQTNPHAEKIAFNYINKAAEKGMPKAQFILGNMYEKGVGINKNAKLAYKNYHRAAHQGYVPAIVNLGNAYAKGIGVKQDEKQALYWWRQAARHYNPAAEYNIAYAYENGKGIKKNLAIATRWYKRSAKHNNFHANRRLAFIYLRDNKNPKHYKLAAHYFTKAADQGDILAQTNLAVMYIKGMGVKKNINKGISLLKTAALHGDATAQYNLTVFYGFGQFTKRDLIQAYAWAMLGAKKDKRLRELMKTWQGKLSQSEINKADAMAKRFHERYLAAQHVVK